MTRPTHQLPNGDVVFPAGNPAAVPLPAGYWQARDESAAWAALRAKRDECLRLCDWTQLTTARLSAAQRLAWNAYRDALFDLPENTINPFLPVWPVPPQ